MIIAASAKYPVAVFKKATASIESCKVLLAGARAANMPDNETNPKETYYIVSG